MGDLVIMPRRTTHSYRNPDEDTDVDAPAAEPKRKRRGMPPWMKFVGATAAGTVVGILVTRKFDEYYPPEPKGKRNEELEPNPQGALPAATAGAPFMPIIFGGGAAPAPPAQQNPAPKRKRRKSVAELTQELRQRRQEERAARYATAEESFFDEDD